MVGWMPNLDPPKFPKDDKNVSPRKTPKSVNACPCRHCGSGKQWDYKCKHSQKGERQARVNFVELSDPDMEVLNAYNNLYYRLELTDVSSNKKLDFREPLLSSD